MNLVKFCSNIDLVNTAEATFGDGILFGDLFVIPYFNLHISGCTKDSELYLYNGKYIEYSYLVFKSINTITWDYDVSRLIPPSKRECYGGEYYSLGEHKEFWISYGSASIYVDGEVSSSSNPFVGNEVVESEFFRLSQITESSFVL